MAHSTTILGDSYAQPSLSLTPAVLRPKVQDASDNVRDVRRVQVAPLRLEVGFRDLHGAEQDSSLTATARGRCVKENNFVSRGDLACN